MTLAGGLVLVHGGLLSHGSGLAREDGIPALIHVDKALQEIETADPLWLDTDRKMLRIVRQATGPQEPGPHLLRRQSASR